MYILIDILVIAFIVGFIIYGAKCGFFGSTIDVLLIIICIAGAGFLSLLTVTKLFVTWGWLTEVTEFFVNLLGYSKIAGGQEIVAMVSLYIAYGVLFLLTFVVYSVILHLLRKLSLKGFKSLKRCKLIGWVDNFLGGFVNAVVSIALLLAVMAFFHAFLGSELTIFSNVSEAFLATDVLCFVYDVNPLNTVFENLELAKTLEEVLLPFLG